MEGFTQEFTSEGDMYYAAKPPGPISPGESIPAQTPTPSTGEGAPAPVEDPGALNTNPTLPTLPGQENNAPVTNVEPYRGIVEGVGQSPWPQPTEQFNEPQMAQQAREVAAQRTRESVIPPGGRAELDQLPGAIAEQAIGLGLGALKPLQLIKQFPRLSAGLMAAGITATASKAGERSNLNKEWWKTPIEDPPEIPSFEHPEFKPKPLSPQDEAQFQQVDVEKAMAAYKDPPRRRGEDRDEYNKRLVKEKETFQKNLTASNERKAKDRQTLLDKQNDYDYKSYQDGKKTAKEVYDLKVATTQRLYEKYQRDQEIADEKFRLKNQPFIEAYPEVSFALPIIMAAMGGYMTFRNRQQIRNSAEVAIKEMEKIIAGAEEAVAKKGVGGPAARLGSQVGLEESLKKAGVLATDSGTIDLLIRMGLSGTLAAHGATLPYGYDLIMHPPGSYAHEMAKDPWAWLRRGGLGFAEGALMSSFGREWPMRQANIPTTTLKSKLTEIEALVAADNKAAALKEIRDSAKAIRDMEAKSQAELAAQAAEVTKEYGPDFLKKSLAERQRIVLEKHPELRQVPFVTGDPAKDEALMRATYTMEKYWGKHIKPNPGGNIEGGGGSAFVNTPRPGGAADPWGVKANLDMWKGSPHEVKNIEGRIRSLLYDSRLSGASMRDEESLQRVYKDGGASLRNAIKQLRDRLKELRK